MTTARQRTEVQFGEYSQWEAATDIYHDGALAYAEGHPVPAANVTAHGYDRTDPPLVRRPAAWQKAQGAADEDDARDQMQDQLDAELLEESDRG